VKNPSRKKISAAGRQITRRPGAVAAVKPNNKRAEQKTTSTETLKDSELRYRRLFETAQDGILILDAQTGAISDVNPFLVEMLGYSREEFMEKKLWEVGAFKDIKASKDAFQALQKNKYIRYKDLPLKTKSGKLVPVEFISNVYSEGSKKVIQCNIRDISERKHIQDALLKSESFLREQSVRDHLTGLFNRRYLEETLERELHRASRNQHPLSIIMLDVNDFKRYNDLYGHATGDAILRKLGSLLLSHFRREDISSRYGGDEFIIVLPDASKEITLELAERLREQVRHLTIQFEGHSMMTLTLSIGLAVFPEDGSTSEAIMRAADEALYRAKREGPGR
jgi:diguanylate cyclase (GGDEF)-like protein/PAS domain S-box-containing protein